MKKISLIPMIIAVITAVSLKADVSYDSDKNIMTVKNTLPSAPMTPKQLYRVDQLKGWEKVKFDKDKNIYTLDSTLVIGSNDGSDSIFKIGGAGTEGETLIVKGNVYVMPFWIKGLNKKSRTDSKKGLNALIIGDEKNKDIKGILKLDCDKKDQFSLYVGCAPAANGKFITGRGGALRVYNSMVTSNKTNAPIKGMILVGKCEIDFLNSIFSHMSGIMTYGADTYAREYRIEGCTFSNGNIAFVGSRQKLKKCTIENCKVAFLDYGGLDITLEQCILKNNVSNWVLRYTTTGLTAIDCNISHARRNNYLSLKNPKIKKQVFPWFKSKRHINVEVVDSKNKPIKDATVLIKCDQKLEDMEKVEPCKTGENGRTPTILLVEKIVQSTAKPNQPEYKTFTYSITVNKDGYSENIMKDFKPVKTGEVVRIKLDDK